MLAGIVAEAGAPNLWLLQSQIASHESFMFLLADATAALQPLLPLPELVEALILLVEVQQKSGPVGDLAAPACEEAILKRNAILQAAGLASWVRGDLAIHPLLPLRFLDCHVSLIIL